MVTRREFSKLALAAVPVAALGGIDSKVHGVQIGVQSYSFRDRSLDDAIKGMVEIGLGECELYEGHVEPKLSRDELRKWRTTVSMDHFRGVRKKFDDAGILLYAYNYSFRDNFTDEEIARGFEMAQALGVGIITASSTLTVVDRVDREAQKARIKVGLHGHADVKHPNEFSTPETFEKAMAGHSKYINVNLDIGHFFAAGFDPVDFIDQAPRADRDAAHQRPQEEPRREHAVRGGRHAHQARSSIAEDEEVRYSREHRIRIQRRRYGGGSEEVFRVLQTALG